MEDLIQQIITKSEQSKKMYLIYSLILFFVGMIIIVLSLLPLIHGDLIKKAFCFSGTFVAILGFFPIKEYFSKKANISLLNFLLLKLKENKHVLTDQEIKIIEEYVFKLK
jgi:hypothetical protein